MALTTSTDVAPTMFTLVAPRFPLVPRDRPSCPALDARIAHVAALAAKAAEGGDNALLRAGEAHNLAALIASDCGLPDLAHSLCWRQVDTLPFRRPLGGATAKLALQPLINLARLRLRTGDGLGAYRLLATLYSAVAAKTEATLDGRTLAFNDFVTPADHPQVVSWLWTVLLADGTRALTRTGRWTEALDHLHRHRGIGQRLLDGRQTAILAHHARQDHHAAEQILASTAITQPWEQAVATCLRLLHDHLTGREAAGDGWNMVSELSMSDPPGHSSFHTQLGLCLLDLAGTSQHLRPALGTIISSALRSGDAYAARDLLNHQAARSHLRDDQLALFTETQRRSGLGSGHLPDALHEQLVDALVLAVCALTKP
ncbi:hypothetical protein MXD61_09900 [Frankia sp. AgPm24]|uniref:hypothetical protein n=1 Tax=Frankia sp. AgPm24 TaxID=631128 RepID=UPI00200FD925|nr:hypothetical protein [Frankia sp. AgPm24]MCK9922188.1 hypothetical protein [Frankia sp. AgPm24]